MKIIFKLISVVGLLIFVLYGIFIRWPRDKVRANINYQKFYNSEINGRIVEISPYRSYIYYFKIENDTNTYKSLFIYLGKDGKPMQFQVFAERGDTIVKSKESDTFILVKNGLKYYYMIGKPGE